MKILSKAVFFLALIICLLSGCNSEDKSGRALEEQQETVQIPHLYKQGKATQLIVNGNPFIILGGELGNSTFTSVEYMEPVWPKLSTMHLNTVLAPVYWELIEPEEGKFDFDLLDRLVVEARHHDLKLVLLWFGSWKNSMSSHAPAWVKRDQERFPRTKDAEGKSHEILTPFSDNNLEADKSAFKALMEHIRVLDKGKSTIIMMQVENEIGMLLSARDHSEPANEKFNADVPDEFMHYLEANKGNLVPELSEVWAENGYRDSGTWEEVFGKGLQADEIFMAWYYAKFTDAVTRAGKEAYSLPMYVNAALNRTGREPGSGYPSAGPLPHLMDVWIAGAPSVDFLSPDLYFGDIRHWCGLFVRRGNPLFIPEHRFDNTAAAKSVFSIGHYESIGFSPFSIESVADPDIEPLGKVYDLLGNMVPLITENLGRGRNEGVLLDKDHPETVLRMGDYEITMRHSFTLGYEAGWKDEKWPMTGVIVIQTGENEFYFAGSGFVATFKNAAHTDQIVGLLKVDEGRFENSHWKIMRHLNGDQTHQGRHVRMFVNNYSVQKVELYGYR
ncbi:MAG TPA: DUF5597 domain-containing protein [Bacteroidales bacterium]|nr:DUF5597 domain-containing protein [Bacteroidales bacterium]